MVFFGFAMEHGEMMMEMPWTLLKWFGARIASIIGMGQVAFANFIRKNPTNTEAVLKCRCSLTIFAPTEKGKKMSDRKKLTEVIYSMDFCSWGWARRIANQLISNGVTFQRWIPVTERLPENGKVVLVYGKRGGIYTAWCNRLYKNPGWHKLNSKSHYCEPTHWMPLPEPPKGV